MHFVSPSEDNYLIANWAKHTTVELGEMLNWSEKQVRERGRKLGLPGRKEIHAALTRQSEAARRARQKALRPLSETTEPRHTVMAWADGWSIKPPTLAQLMGRK